MIPPAFRVARLSALVALLWAAATVISILGFRGMRWLDTREA